MESSEFVRTCMDRSKSLQLQIEGLKSELADINTAIRVYQQLNKPGSLASIQESLPSAAQRVISRFGRPMRAPEIASVLIKEGYRPETTDVSQLSATLFTAMTRCADRFFKVESGLWDVVRSPQRSQVAAIPAGDLAATASPPSAHVPSAVRAIGGSK